MNGAGFDKVGIGAGGKAAGKAEIAKFDGEIVRIRTGQGEAGVEDFNAGEETRVAGEGRESFNELTDGKESEPGREGMGAGEPGVEPFAVKKFRNVIVRAFVFAAFKDAEEVTVAERGSQLDKVLERGGIALALGGADSHVKFNKAVQVVIEGEARNLVVAAPDLDGIAVLILTNGIVAESLKRHGEKMGKSGKGDFPGNFSQKGASGDSYFIIFRRGKFSVF